MESLHEWKCRWACPKHGGKRQQGEQAAGLLLFPTSCQAKQGQNTSLLQAGGPAVGATPRPTGRAGPPPPFILDCRLAHWVRGKDAFSSLEVLRTHLGDKPCSFKGFPHFSVPYLRSPPEKAQGLVEQNVKPGAGPPCSHQNLEDLHLHPHCNSEPGVWPVWGKWGASAHRSRDTGWRALAQGAGGGGQRGRQVGVGLGRPGVCVSAGCWAALSSLSFLQQLPQHGESGRPGSHPWSAALLRGFLPAAGPDCGGHDWCLAWSLQGRHRLGGRPAV